MDVLIVVLGLVFWHCAGYFDIQVTSMMKLILEFVPVNIPH